MQHTESKKVIKGKITVSEEETELAIVLLKEIAYDNGFFNRWAPEHYNAKWVNQIGPLAKQFFDNNPTKLTNEDLEEICSGEETEVQETYAHLIGFKELHEALNDYFNNH